MILCVLSQLHTCFSSITSRDTKAVNPQRFTKKANQSKVTACPYLRDVSGVLDSTSFVHFLFLLFLFFLFFSFFSFFSFFWLSVFPSSSVSPDSSVALISPVPEFSLLGLCDSFASSWLLLSWWVGGTVELLMSSVSLDRSLMTFLSLILESSPVFEVNASYS